MITILLWVISWAMTAWGQPHLSTLLSLATSTLSIGLFWLSMMRIQGYQKRFLLSSLWFFAVQLVQISWMASPTYQGLYIFFVYGAIALWLGLQFGLLSFLFPKRGKLSFRVILALSALWTLFEWSRLYLLCGFAWNPLGLSLCSLNITSQFASVGGVFALSFLVMATNLLALNFLMTLRKAHLMLWAAAISFPVLFGSLHLLLNRTSPGPSYQVALVQTDLLPDEKQLFADRKAHFVHPYLQWREIYLQIKKLGSMSYDLIVLPECAVPFSAFTPLYPIEEMAPFMGVREEEFSSLLRAPYAELREEKWFVSNAFWAKLLAETYQADLVIGLEATDQRGSYNAAFYFPSSKSDEWVRYEKRVLLPLAEYLPFPFLKPLVARYGISDFFTPGDEAKVLGQGLPMSLSVCYEECFPNLMREGRKKGAELFVNVTNDGWYPNTCLPHVHFIHSRLRAIENGVPLVRACNTGVSAAIDSLGTVVAMLEKGRGVVTTPLSLQGHPTLYSFWGDAFILFISLLSLLQYPGLYLGWKRWVYSFFDQEKSGYAPPPTSS